jgi:hypothetical protein
MNGKTLVFKDSLGVELRFSNRNGAQTTFVTNSYKRLCSFALGFGGGFEQIDMAEIVINFTTPTFESNLEYTVFVGDSSPIEIKDTVLYDMFKLSMGKPSALTSIIGFAELSKRGTVKPNRDLNNIVIENITLLGKPFKQVINAKNGLKNPTLEPLEVYYNTTQGVVAMRLLNGKLFVLDRIE